MSKKPGESNNDFLSRLGVTSVDETEHAKLVMDRAIAKSAAGLATSASIATIKALLLEKRQDLRTTLKGRGLSTVFIKEPSVGLKIDSLRLKINQLEKLLKAKEEAEGPKRAAFNATDILGSMGGPNSFSKAVQRKPLPRSVVPGGLQDITGEGSSIASTNAGDEFDADYDAIPQTSDLTSFGITQKTSFQDLSRKSMKDISRLSTSVQSQPKSNTVVPGSASLLSASTETTDNRNISSQANISESPSSMLKKLPLPLPLPTKSTVAAKQHGEVKGSRETSLATTASAVPSEVTSLKRSRVDDDDSLDDSIEPAVVCPICSKDISSFGELTQKSHISRCRGRRQLDIASPNIVFPSVNESTSALGDEESSASSGSEEKVRPRAIKRTKGTTRRKSQVTTDTIFSREDVDEDTPTPRITKMERATGEESLIDDWEEYHYQKRLVQFVSELLRLSSLPYALPSYALKASNDLRITSSGPGSDSVSADHDHVPIMTATRASTEYVNPLSQLTLRDVEKIRGLIASVPAVSSAVKLFLSDMYEQEGGAGVSKAVMNNFINRILSSDVDDTLEVPEGFSLYNVLQVFFSTEVAQLPNKSFAHIFNVLHRNELKFLSANPGIIAEAPSAASGLAAPTNPPCARRPNPLPFYIRPSLLPYQLEGSRWLLDIASGAERNALQSNNQAPLLADPTGAAAEGRGAIKAAKIGRKNAYKGEGDEANPFLSMVHRSRAGGGLEHVGGSGGLLGDEMGLGKTVQVAAMLSALSFAKRLGVGVILCPGTVLQHWLRELNVWAPTVRVFVHHSSSIRSYGSSASGTNGINSYSGVSGIDILRRSMMQTAQQYHLNAGTSDPPTSIEEHFRGYGCVILTTYDNFRHQAREFMSYKYEFLILDEGHKIRRSDSAISQLVRVVGMTVPLRLILSGSPIQNSLKELWSLFDFLLPSLLGPLPVFEKEFVFPINRGAETGTTPMQAQIALKRAETLKSLLKPYLLRRLKRDVNASLPQKTERVLFCRLSPGQRETYVKFLNSESVMRLIAEHNEKYGEEDAALERMKEGKYNTSADRQQKVLMQAQARFSKDYSSQEARIFTAITSLRKICNHPLLYQVPVVSQMQLRKMKENQRNFEAAEAFRLRYGPNSYGPSSPSDVKSPTSGKLKDAAGNWNSLSRSGHVKNPFVSSDSYQYMTTPEVGNEAIEDEDYDPTTLSGLISREKSVDDLINSSGKLIVLFAQLDIWFREHTNQAPSEANSSMNSNNEASPTGGSRRIRSAMNRRSIGFDDRGDGQPFSEDGTGLLRNKVLIFSQMVGVLDIIEHIIRLRGYKYLRMDGRTSVSERQKRVDLFNRREDIFIFLLTTRVGGVGINLTGANKVVIFDPDWNPATDSQARERAWRLGQTRPVEVVRLILGGTLEEKMYQRQVYKLALSARILSRVGGTGKIFKKRDLMDLFSLTDNKEGSTVPTETALSMPSAILEGATSVNHDDLEENIRFVRRRNDQARNRITNDNESPSSSDVESDSSKLSDDINTGAASSSVSLFSSVMDSTLPPYVSQSSVPTPVSMLPNVASALSQDVVDRIAEGARSSSITGIAQHEAQRALRALQQAAKEAADAADAPRKLQLWREERARVAREERLKRELKDKEKENSQKLANIKSESSRTPMPKSEPTSSSKKKVSIKREKAVESLQSRHPKSRNSNVSEAVDLATLESIMNEEKNDFPSASSVHANEVSNRDNGEVVDLITDEEVSEDEASVSRTTRPSSRLDSEIEEVSSEMMHNILVSSSIDYNTGIHSSEGPQQINSGLLASLKGTPVMRRIREIAQRALPPPMVFGQWVSPAAVGSGFVSPFKAFDRIPNSMNPDDNRWRELLYVPLYHPQKQTKKRLVCLNVVPPDVSSAYRYYVDDESVSSDSELFSESLELSSISDIFGAATPVFSPKMTPAYGSIQLPESHFIIKSESQPSNEATANSTVSTIAPVQQLQPKAVQSRPMAAGQPNVSTESSVQRINLMFSNSKALGKTKKWVPLSSMSRPGAIDFRKLAFTGIHHAAAGTSDRRLPNSQHLSQSNLDAITKFQPNPINFDPVNGAYYDSTGSFCDFRGLAWPMDPQFLVSFLSTGNKGTRRHILFKPIYRRHNLLTSRSSPDHTMLDSSNSDNPSEALVVRDRKNPLLGISAITLSSPSNLSDEVALEIVRLRALYEEKKAKLLERDMYFTTGEGSARAGGGWSGTSDKPSFSAMKAPQSILFGVKETIFGSSPSCSRQGPLHSSTVLRFLRSIGAEGEVEFIV